MSATASNSAPNTVSAHEGLVARLQRAGIATATRTAGLLQSGLGLLSHQMQRPKNGSWQGETAWVMDGLKHNALDGLDVQEALGVISLERKQLEQGELAQAGKVAKQALFSTPSPIASAIELQKHVGGFTQKCLSILGDLKRLTEGESDKQAESPYESRRARAIEKESSAPTINI